MFDVATALASVDKELTRSRYVYVAWFIAAKILLKKLILLSGPT